MILDSTTLFWLQNAFITFFCNTLILSVVSKTNFFKMFLYFFLPNLLILFFCFGMHVVTFLVLSYMGFFLWDFTGFYQGTVSGDMLLAGITYLATYGAAVSFVWNIKEYPRLKLYLFIPYFMGAIITYVHWSMIR